LQRVVGQLRLGLVALKPHAFWHLVRVRVRVRVKG